MHQVREIWIFEKIRSQKIFFSKKNSENNRNVFSPMTWWRGFWRFISIDKNFNQAIWNCLHWWKKTEELKLWNVLTKHSIEFLPKGAYFLQSTKKCFSLCLRFNNIPRPHKNSREKSENYPQPSSINPTLLRCFCVYSSVKNFAFGQAQPKSHIEE